MSQATVTTTSVFTPESGTTLACGLPRLLPIPPTVRRYGLALKRSAASTIARSDSDRRRRIGSGATVSSGVGPAGIEEGAEVEPPSPWLFFEGRRGRAPFLDPALLRRDLLAERTDVHEVLAVRSKTRRALADEERPVADRADLRGKSARRPHPPATIAHPAARASTAILASMCVLHCNLIYAS